MVRKKICVVTGSRADWGLLRPLMEALRGDSRFDTHLLVTGSHLSRQFGYTIDEIRQAGFTISGELKLPIDVDQPTTMAASIAAAVVGADQFFRSAKPDLVILLGDRFEIFAVATATLTSSVPLAHLCGGDVSAGAFDESLRHAITKLAHIHFVTNKDAYGRVQSMGEANVHLVGSTGLDAIRNMRLEDRFVLERELGIDLRQTSFLVTFHPVTRSEQDSLMQLDELLDALIPWLGRASIIFTLPNSDPGNEGIRKRIEAFISGKEDCRSFESLGSQRYLSLMAASSLVLGNSSSGLYEAPFLGIPSVDVGDRQEGRLRPDSAIHARASKGDILEAIDRALRMSVRAGVSPYGDGHSTERIVSVLAGYGDFRSLLKKRFQEA